MSDDIGSYAASSNHVKHACPGVAPSCARAAVEMTIKKFATHSFSMIASVGMTCSGRPSWASCMNCKAANCRFFSGCTAKATRRVCGAMRACCPDDEAHTACAQDPRSKGCKTRVCPEKGPVAKALPSRCFITPGGVPAGIPGGVSTGDMPDGAALTQEFENANAKAREDLLPNIADASACLMAFLFQRTCDDEITIDFKSVFEDLDTMPDGAEVAALSRQETGKATPLGVESVVGSTGDMPDGADALNGVSLLRGDGGRVRLAVNGERGQCLSSFA